MEEMQIVRVCSHGKIENLSTGFMHERQVPFSVYVRPKNNTMMTDVVINARCICDEEVSALPVPLNDWTPAAIVEIAPDAISLDDYDIYWGAGNPKN